MFFDCSKDNKELQKTYNEDLKEYNFQIKNSENQIKTIDVSLDFFEVQPLLIYCILVIAITYISVLGVKSPEIKEVLNSRMALRLARLFAFV